VQVLEIVLVEEVIIEVAELSVGIGPEDAEVYCVDVGPDLAQHVLQHFEEEFFLKAAGVGQVLEVGWVYLLPQGLLEDL